MRSHLKGALITAGRIARREPFTLTMLLVLAGVALATDTHVADLSLRLFNRLGFAPRDLIRLHWERLFTSALVTDGPIAFWSAMGITALASGIAEWRAGSTWAAATFWGVHLLTLVIESLLMALPMHLLGLSIGTALVLARDVGPSAGYFGSLGLAAWSLGGHWRWWACGAIMGGLVIALLLPKAAGASSVTALSANLAHLVAFPCGAGVGILYFRRRPASRVTPT